MNKDIFVESYELPIDQPIVSSNSEHGYLLSGVQTNKKAWEWIMNNYIHQVLVFCQTNYDMDFFPMSNHAICPCIDYQRISKELILEKWSSAVEFLIESISKENYVYVHLNWYYLKPSSDFKINHHMHPTLIYGFDRNQELFSVGDFYDNGKFTFTQVPFAAVEQAFKNNEQNKKMTFTNIRYNSAYDAILYKNRKESNYDFDKKIFVNAICDYLNSVDISKHYGRGDYFFYQRKYETFSTTFGLKSYNMLYDFLLSEPLDYVKYKIITVPIERITLMIKRLDFLHKKNMIKNVQELTDKFVAIKIKLEIVKGLIVKFNLTPKHELMVKICNLLLVIKDLESNAYTMLLENICN
ncbi:MAG: hypothetical protein KHZ13_06420 [Firmicutes bacterium]|nr:hypothetical protein [Bacillota bacterium]